MQASTGANTDSHRESGGMEARRKKITGRSEEAVRQVDERFRSCAGEVDGVPEYASADGWREEKRSSPLAR
jgi:hypothetical protein